MALRSQADLNGRCDQLASKLVAFLAAQLVGERDRCLVECWWKRRAKKKWDFFDVTGGRRSCRHDRRAFEDRVRVSGATLAERDAAPF